MASLTLKNIPEELHRALREAAQDDRRSVSQEIMHLLDSALRSRSERPPPRSAGTQAQVAAWRELAGRWVSKVDLATETARLRKRRSRGREVEL